MYGLQRRSKEPSAFRFERRLNGIAAAVLQIEYLQTKISMGKEQITYLRLTVCRHAARQLVFVCFLERMS